MDSRKDQAVLRQISFTILETINHMLERGSKMFSCVIDVGKAFDTVWIDGLCTSYFLIWVSTVNCG